MADTMQAGVIEGFFGTPWSWAARMSGAEFLRDCGYRFYVYAPKAEAFLRRRWREPIPADTERRLADLKSHCRELGVHFGIGLTPFEIYLDYDAAARAALRSKVVQINEIGPDILCILFDDMRGDVAGLADLQAKIIADICARSTAARFIVCPTYYSYDSRLARQFGAQPKAYLRDFGHALDPGIDVFWTGEKVISNGYPAAHLAEVAADLGRKPFIWDSHISNDSKVRTNHLYLNPADVSWELVNELVAGIAINPMNQPHLSRIALCEFKALLAGTGQTAATRPGICGQLYPADFADELAQDGPLLQTVGLNGLDPDVRCRLLDRYGARLSNPYAQEIAAWLRNEYQFDPQCLTS
jgi:hyaluronoglucosaminidase